MPDGRPKGRLIFVRHGRTAWNDDGRCQGWEDVPLDAEGHHQAVKVADRLSSWRIDEIYTSDLARARETAEVLARVKGLPLQVERDLREVHFGACQGHTMADLAGTDLGTTWKAWKLGHRFEALPGGEHPCETLERVQRFLDPLIASLDDRHVAIVGHGSTFRLVFSSLLGMPLERWRYLDQSNTGITVFDVDHDIISLTLFNDTCHLHHKIAEQPGPDLVHAE
jgi:broad specificity phosphatase PhoE